MEWIMMWSSNSYSMIMFPLTHVIFYANKDAMSWALWAVAAS